MPTQPRQRNEIVAAYLSLPVVTRFVLSATLGVTLLLKMGMIPFPSPRRWILREIMSTVVGFFYGGNGLNLLFNLFFLYQYSNQLETGRYASKSADYTWFLIWCSAAIRALHIPLGGGLYNSALTQAIVYYWSQDFKNQIVTFMFGFKFKALYLPYVLLGMEMLTSGPTAAISSATGLAAAYAFNYLDYAYPLSKRRAASGITTPRFATVGSSTAQPARESLPVTGTRRFTATPAFMRRLIPDGHSGSSGGSSGYMFRPGQTQTQAQGAAPRSNVFGGGYSWGRGQRLG